MISVIPSGESSAPPGGNKSRSEPSGSGTTELKCAINSERSSSVRQLRIAWMKNDKFLLGVVRKSYTSSHIAQLDLIELDSQGHRWQPLSKKPLENRRTERTLAARSFISDPSGMGTLPSLRSPSQPDALHVLASPRHRARIMPGIEHDVERIDPRIRRDTSISPDTRADRSAGAIRASACSTGDRSRSARACGARLQGRLGVEAVAFQAAVGALLDPDAQPGAGLAHGAQLFLGVERAVAQARWPEHGHHPQQRSASHARRERGAACQPAGTGADRLGRAGLGPASHRPPQDTPESAMPGPMANEPKPAARRH
ncbi:hypothetical protein FQR65_LT20302 [Abscondita terminalis]|nr:hypothetical protein FQR65_LT20302 [Abscondita terminalis]